MHFTRLAPRLAAALSVAAACALGASSVAMADSAAVSFTDAAGKSDPVVGVGRTLTVTGNVASPTRIYVRVRPAGGAPCAPSASSDTADSSYYGSFSGADFYGSAVEGNYTLQKTGNWSTAGTFQYCVWLASSSTTPTVPISQVITFRNPNGTVSATISPTVPQAKTKATITIAGSSEAPAQAYASVRLAGGAPCAPSMAAETGDSVLYGRDVNGLFTATTTYTPDAPGAYLMCLYLAKNSTDPAPIAVQPITFDVVAPCVVPSIAPGTSLDAARGALAAASCSVGTQSLQPSSLPRGTVVSATPTAGTSLPTGGAVGLVISDGKACKVPASRAGIKLSQAKRKLASAGCTVGTIKRARSKRKKGTIVRFGPKAGTTLAPRAVVSITVSKGRR